MQSKLQRAGPPELSNPKGRQHGRAEAALTLEFHLSLLLATYAGASYFDHQSLNLFICKVKLIALFVESFK